MKSVFKALFVVVFIINMSMLQAQTKSWTGATDNSWFTSSTWSPTGVPDTLDRVQINIPTGDTISIYARDSINTSIRFEQLFVTGNSSEKLILYVDTMSVYGDEINFGQSNATNIDIIPTDTSNWNAKANLFVLDDCTLRNNLIDESLMYLNIHVDSGTALIFMDDFKSINTDLYINGKVEIYNKVLNVDKIVVIDNIHNQEPSFIATNSTIILVGDEPIAGFEYLESPNFNTTQLNLGLRS